MVTYTVPEKQRALILQGGGTLAAYGAGVFEALSEQLSEGDTDRPLFDIVAGTSGGAINAALLVSYFRDNKTWKGAAERLSNYWRNISVDLSKEVDFGSAGGMKSIRMILMLQRMKRPEDTTLQSIFYKMAYMGNFQNQT